VTAVTGQTDTARLTRQEFADRANLTYGTLNTYLARSRQRLAEGLALRPQDPPLPDGYTGSTPWWWPSTVDAYLAAQPGRKDES
jgi:hypothetical protein